MSYTAILCVLMLLRMCLYMCPHTIYVSYTARCVLMLLHMCLYMCPHVCAYICVLILYMCPILLDESSCCYVCAYICVRILCMCLYMCPHTIYVSSCCYVCAYICPHTTYVPLYVSSYIYVSSYNALGTLRPLSRCLFFPFCFCDLLSYTWLLQAIYVSSDLLSYSSMRALGI